MSKEKKTIIIWDEYQEQVYDHRVSLLIADELKKYANLVFLVCKQDSFTKELEERNLEYRLISATVSPTQKSSFFGKISLMMRLNKQVSEAEKIFKEIAPDAIYAFGVQSILSATVSTEEAAIPVVWHLNDTQHDEGSIKTIRTLSLKKHVKLIFSATRTMGELTVADLALSKLNIVRGVSFDVNNFVSAISQDAANEYASFVRHDIVLGQVAPIMQEKNQVDSLRIASNLVKKGYDTVIVYVGEVLDQSYGQQLLSSIQETEMEDRCLVVTEHSHASAIYPLLDYLLIPSIEGYPQSGVEANSHGVVVLGADAAGVREMIQAGMSGKTFPKGNTEDAVETIVHLVEHPKEYAQLQKQANRYAERQTSDRFVSRIVRALKKERLL